MLLSYSCVPYDQRTLICLHERQIAGETVRLSQYLDQVTGFESQQGQEFFVLPCNNSFHEHGERYVLCDQIGYLWHAVRMSPAG